MIFVWLSVNPPERRWCSRRGAHLHIINYYILRARIFEILAKASNRDSISTTACNVLDKDVVRSWLDCNAVITALVNEIGQPDVLCIHGIYNLVSATEGSSQLARSINAYRTHQYFAPNCHHKAPL